MRRIVALCFTLFFAVEAVAHPGHPALRADHTHGLLEIALVAGIALFAAVAVAAYSGNLLRRRSIDRE